MAFSFPPKESKYQINRAGYALINYGVGTPQYNDALILADKWRACHAYPINTFQATLRRKAKKLSNNPIIAQRLKRMPTIINKLGRYPSMRLAQMQDIGGVRAVLESVADVNKLASEYRQKSRFEHELVTEKNYIQNPRNEDGYRSLHLIYKYKNKRAPTYNDLLLELQIRTKLQHTWATAVETMGTVLGQGLKSRRGDKEWIDFFAVTSSAFAYEENTELVPRFKDLTREQTFQAVARSAEEIKALEKMKGFSIAVNEIVKKGAHRAGWSYHLIILNSLQKTVEITAYTRDNFKKAAAHYAEIEARITKGEKTEAVLVSAGPIEILRRAYPNFFLDISEFVNHIEKIVSIANK
jgi:hypothetical protein